MVKDNLARALGVEASAVTPMPMLLEAAWFLTGMWALPTRVISLHAEREAQSPFSPRVDPRWLSAQGEHVKELRSFRARLDAERTAPTFKPKVPKVSTKAAAKSPAGKAASKAPAK